MPSNPSTILTMMGHASTFKRSGKRTLISLMVPIGILSIPTKLLKLKLLSTKVWQEALDAGFSKDRQHDLRKVVSDHKDVFQALFSSGPLAMVMPLKVSLLSDARQVEVRLCNYSQYQSDFLGCIVFKLVHLGMAFPNPTSPWAFEPLLVPRPGPA